MQVVDEDLETGLQTRRFLAYDIMLINGSSCSGLPFEVTLGLAPPPRADVHPAGDACAPAISCCKLPTSYVSSIMHSTSRA